MCPQQNYCCWRWKSCNTVNKWFTIYFTYGCADPKFLLVPSWFLVVVEQPSVPGATPWRNNLCENDFRLSNFVLHRADVWLSCWYQRWCSTEKIWILLLYHIYVFHSTGCFFFLVEEWKTLMGVGWKYCHSGFTSWNPKSTWPLHWPLTSVLHQLGFWTWWCMLLLKM